MTACVTRRANSPAVLLHERRDLGHRQDVGVFQGHVVEVGEVRALMAVGDAFLRHDGAEATRQAVDHGGAHAARGRPAGHDHGVDLVPGEQRAEVGLEEGRGHALVDDDVAAVDLAALVDGGAPRALLDVLQRIRRVAAGAPDTAILARLEIGDVGPDHRAVLGPEQLRQRIDVLDLPRIGLVGRRELVRARIGILEIDVDQRGLAAEAEAPASYGRP